MAEVVIAAQERLLTIREVARLLAVSVRQVWKLRASGRLPAGVKLARSARWRASDIERFIRAGCVVESGVSR